MAYAGNTCKIYASGTSTAFVDDVAAAVSGQTYQLSAQDRCFDPSVAVTIKENGSATGDTGVYFDYMFGRVRFTTGYAETGPITVSGSYLPLLEIGTARAWELSVDTDLLDATVFGNTARNRAASMRDLSFSLEALEMGGHDHDGGAGSVRLHDILTNGAVKVFSFYVSGDGSDGGSEFRAAVLLNKQNTKVDKMGLVVTGIEGKVSGVTEGADFSMLESLEGGYT